MCERKPACTDALPIGLRMNSRLLITLLCAGAVALACGSLTRNDATTAKKASTVRTASKRAKADTVVKVNGNFAVKIEPHALRFALNLTNESKKHVELSFPNGQQYEFSVIDSAGREVYRWGQGRMFTQSVQNKLIDGGKTMNIDEVAETTLPHGRYIAVATLRSSNFPMEQRSAFELR
ncbi:MAG: Intracellular proteinase inhibitor [Gemmatimonadetes bacterium]|jgi:glycine/D-amino acid oxidase-like deaminating enzyme|nr:Intracellular proteinase inhibitor [Gemmatimonadota bacterium]